MDPGDYLRSLDNESSTPELESEEESIDMGDSTSVELESEEESMDMEDSSTCEFESEVESINMEDLSTPELGSEQESLYMEDDASDNELLPGSDVAGSSCSTNISDLPVASLVGRGLMGLEEVPHDRLGEATQTEVRTPSMNYSLTAKVLRQSQLRNDRFNVQEDISAHGTGLAETSHIEGGIVLVDYSLTPETLQESQSESHSVDAGENILCNFERNPMVQSGPSGNLNEPSNIGKEILPIFVRNSMMQTKPLESMRAFGEIKADFLKDETSNVVPKSCFYKNTYNVTYADISMKLDINKATKFSGTLVIVAEKEAELKDDRDCLVSRGKIDYFDLEGSKTFRVGNKDVRVATLISRLVSKEWVGSVVPKIVPIRKVVEHKESSAQTTEPLPKTEEPNAIGKTWNVTYGKRQNKKNRTYTDDGTLSVLYNKEGKHGVLRDANQKFLIKAPIRDGDVELHSELILGGYQICLGEEQDITEEKHVVGMAIGMNDFPRDTIVMPQPIAVQYVEGEPVVVTEVFVQNYLGSRLLDYEEEELKKMYAVIWDLNATGYEGLIINNANKFDKSFVLLTLFHTITRTGPYGKGLTGKILIIVPDALVNIWEERANGMVYGETNAMVCIEEELDSLKDMASSKKYIIVGHKLLEAKAGPICRIDVSLVLCVEPDFDGMLLPHILARFTGKTILLTSHCFDGDSWTLFKACEFVRPNFFGGSYDAFFNRFYKGSDGSSQEAIEKGRELEETLASFMVMPAFGMN